MDVSFEFTASLRDREVLVQVRDYRVIEDESEDALVFDFRVFDSEEDCELMGLSDHERELVFAMCLREVLNICGS